MKPTQIVIGPCRISYPNLFTAKGSTKFPEQGERFSCDILVPKSDASLVGMMNAAIQAATSEGLEKLWKGAVPKGFKSPVADGDSYDDPNYHGHWILRPWSNKDNRPKVVDQNVKPILDQSAVYGGMWAYVSLNFYPYDNRGAGVGCGFDAGVQKVKDDEPFGGARTSVEDAFSALGTAATAPQAFMPQAPAQPAYQIDPITGLPM